MGGPVRKQACLVCIVVLVVLALPRLAAGEAAASSGRESLVPTVANPRALPAISLMDQVAPDSPEPEWLDDPPLDTGLLMLAAWLPIAGAVIAVAMEGGSPKVRSAREPGSETSLD